MIKRLFFTTFWLAPAILLLSGYAYAYSTNMEASVVIGQTNFTSTSANQGGTASSNTINGARGVAACNGKLFVADRSNHRVLVFNTFPTSNNPSADVVIGQASFTATSANQGGTAAANTLSAPSSVACIGDKLIIGDATNNRVLIYNSIPTTNNASADVVVGQQNFTSGSINQGGTCAANTLRSFTELNATTDDQRLIIGDAGNHRILIYNTIPTTNNASADIVVGQSSFTSCSANQGSSAGANTLQQPRYAYSDGTRLYAGDAGNHRVLVFNTIPTSNNASADVVIGQTSFSGISANQGGTPAANTLNFPNSIVTDGDILIIGDQTNNRILIYNSVPTSNNASADMVIGQQNFTSNSQNQGGTAAANTLTNVYSRAVYQQKLIVSDLQNNRLLVYDSQPPTGSISMEATTATNDINVTLTLSASDFLDSASQIDMLISNSSSFSGASWEDFTTTKSWELSTENGNKIVYAKFRDHIGNESSTYSSNQITLDTSSPGDLKIALKKDAEKIKAGSKVLHTDKRKLTIYMDTDDNATDVTDIKISEHKDFRGANWDEYDSKIDFKLSEGDEKKNLYIKFKDAAGNTSKTYIQEIRLDTTTPILTLESLGTLNTYTGLYKPNTFSLYRLYYYTEPVLLFSGSAENLRYGDEIIIKINDTEYVGNEQSVSPIWIDYQNNKWYTEALYVSYGKHYISIKSRDTANKESDPILIDIIIDPNAGF